MHCGIAASVVQYVPSLLKRLFAYRLIVQIFKAKHPGRRGNAQTHEALLTSTHPTSNTCTIAKNAKNA